MGQRSSNETEQQNSSKTSPKNSPKKNKEPKPENTTKTPEKNNNSTKTKSSGIDAHPYTRGSIIEVLWGVLNYSSSNQNKNASKGIRKLSFADQTQKTEKESSAKDEEEDDDALLSDEEYFETEKNSEKEEDTESKQDDSIKSPSTQGIPRLCDIIDRAQDSTHPKAHESPKYKYYVHYRDFNRRMDEWITEDRILCPPSIGSQKVKARKTEQEQQQKQLDEETRKKKKKEEDRQKRLLAEIGLTSEDAMQQLLLEQQQHGDEPTGQRLTRRQKRKRGGENNDENTQSGGGSGTITGNATNMGTTFPAGNSKQQVALDVVATVEAQELDEHEGLDEASLREHEEVTKVKNVNHVQIGHYRMETWYFSPIPKELMKYGMVEVLYCCEFTLNFFTRKKELLRFQRKPGLRRHPPGNEIYRNGNLSMFEVDGFQERIYCQNLCYIAKLFLDHKTLYFDVDPFLFYVLCEVDHRGFHPVGYFSKEKYSDVGYNLACILTFPCHQRKGYGRFLISFSYELSKKEEKVGSPEKPMSDLGQKAYIPYWTSTMVDYLLHQMDHEEEGNTSIMDMAKKTSIMAEDIIFTFNQLGILKFINGVYFIAADQALLEKLVLKHPVKEPRVDATKLHWTPYLTDVKRDKFSIYSKKPSVAGEEPRGSGGF